MGREGLGVRGLGGKTLEGSRGVWGGVEWSLQEGMGRGPFAYPCDHIFSFGRGRLGSGVGVGVGGPGDTTRIWHDPVLKLCCVTTSLRLGSGVGCGGGGAGVPATPHVYGMTPCSSCAVSSRRYGHGRNTWQIRLAKTAQFRPEPYSVLCPSAKAR